MEHLKGNSMKLHIKKRLAQALKTMNVQSRDISDDDSDGDKSQINSGPNIFTKFNDPMKFWKHQLSIKENEKKVLMAVRILLDSADQIEIFNKKAIYLYLREITGLNTKQVVNNLNKLRKRYRTFKTKWENSEI